MSEQENAAIDRSEEYDLIYADPPWQYDDATTSPDREIENHYPTMDLDGIKNMDVPAADDSVLYLWTTAPKLAEAMEVIEAWGFEYRTGMVWDKKRVGMGHWARIQHEHLLIARRGDFSPPETGSRPASVIREQRTRHSSKPKSVRRILEEAYPDADKIELFARDGRVGWDVWGNEAPSTLQDTLAVTDGGGE